MKENLDDKDKAIIERDKIIRIYSEFIDDLIYDFNNIIIRLREFRSE